MADRLIDYFRKDQEDGVTAPDLSKDCTYAEHIVKARGKKTQLTSASVDASKIHDFGPVLYKTVSGEINQDNHAIVEHDELLEALRSSAELNKKEERARAIQALRYAKRRLEVLIKWNFSIASIERKNLITWAFTNIQKYFRKA